MESNLEKEDEEIELGRLSLPLLFGELARIITANWTAVSAHCGIDSNAVLARMTANACILDCAVKLVTLAREGSLSVAIMHRAVLSGVGTSEARKFIELARAEYAQIREKTAAARVARTTVDSLNISDVRRRIESERRLHEDRMARLDAREKEESRFEPFRRTPLKRNAIIGNAKFMSLVASHWVTIAAALGVSSEDVLPCRHARLHVGVPCSASDLTGHFIALCSSRGKTLGQLWEALTSLQMYHARSILLEIAEASNSGVGAALAGADRLRADDSAFKRASSTCSAEPESLETAWACLQCEGAERRALVLPCRHAYYCANCWRWLFVMVSRPCACGSVVDGVSLLQLQEDSTRVQRH